MVLSLNVRDNAPFEIGAMLDVVLCYPTFTPERQVKIANALCARLVKEWIALEPHRAVELRAPLREYRRVSGRASCGMLEKRRQKSLIAGQSFLPLIKQAAYGELPVLEGVNRQLSRHQIASQLWPAMEGGYEENYESRLRDRKENDIWPWYSVAHLAAAYEGLARLGAGHEEGSEFDYQDLNFHIRAVMLASEFARHFRTVPQLADIAGKLLNIEIIL